MSSWDGEGRDEHGDAPKQKHRSSQGTTSTPNYGSMFVEYQGDDEARHHTDANRFNSLIENDRSQEQPSTNLTEVSFL